MRSTSLLAPAQVGLIIIHLQHASLLSIRHCCAQPFCVQQSMPCSTTHGFSEYLCNIYLQLIASHGKDEDRWAVERTDSWKRQQKEKKGGSDKQHRGTEKSMSASLDWRNQCEKSTSVQEP